MMNYKTFRSNIEALIKRARAKRHLEVCVEFTPDNEQDVRALVSKPDCIFINGYNDPDQLARKIEECCELIEIGGLIFIAHVAPDDLNERDGQAFQTFARLRCIPYYGTTGVVELKENKLSDQVGYMMIHGQPTNYTKRKLDHPLNFNEYYEIRKELMGIISISQFIDYVL